MTYQKVRFLLMCSSTISTTFIAGIHYERHISSQKICKPVSSDLPIFSIMSHSPKANSNTEIFLNNLYDIIHKFIPKSFGIIEAASPINQPSYSDETNKLGTINSNRVSQIMKYGYPGMSNIISYNDYVLSYDKRNRVAHWVLEHLTEASVKKNDEVDRSKCNFAEAEHVHAYFRSYNSDYKGSGYDRGHLAAAGNHKTHQKLVEETFYLTNIAPQVGKGFNRDSWNRLEKYVRKLTKIYPNVYCCTGPLYLPKKDSNGKTYVKYEVIGTHHVAVPTHFFKVVVGETKEGNLEMESYVMENTVIDDNISLRSFQVPVDFVERSAGLLFFDNMTKSRFLKINGKKM
ncbi:hypothetical protein ABEB36_005188 [Hypothenemus hampei]|uniref:Endonuclease n=1 Tax=Hypothenemus hampei TaxID=57062 RepID=A0ABD1EXC1_HYPHA